MEKDFKVGDTVKVVGHPFLKEGILAKIKEIIVKDFYRIEFISDDIDFLIDIKYLEKIKEEWLHFTTTNKGSDPLISTRDKLDKESRLYNYMYQWKQKFDPVEVDCKNNEDRWYIYRYYDGEWYIFNWVKNYTYGVKQNLEVYFTTEEKAEQCLEWLKKEGVLY